MNQVNHGKLFINSNYTLENSLDCMFTVKLKVTLEEEQDESSFAFLTDFLHMFCHCIFLVKKLGPWGLKGSLINSKHYIFPHSHSQTGQFSSSQQYPRQSASGSLFPRHSVNMVEQQPRSVSAANTVAFYLLSLVVFLLLQLYRFCSI